MVVPRGLGHRKDNRHLRIEPGLARFREIGSGIERQPVRGLVQPVGRQLSAAAIFIGDAIGDRFPAVIDPAVKRVRESATAVGDPSLTEDQARVEVELVDGRVLRGSVEQSLGNVHRPLSDEQLNDKFRGQSVLALPSPQVDAALDLCWRLADLRDVSELIAASVPAPAVVAAAGGVSR